MKYRHVTTSLTSYYTNSQICICLEKKCETDVCFNKWNNNSLPFATLSYYTVAILINYQNTRI